MMIRNEWGVEMDFDKVVKLMDAEIKEDLKKRIMPCNEQGFYDTYCEDHYLKFGCEFEMENLKPRW